MADEDATTEPKVDLTFATADQLWDELKVRFRSCILVYEREVPGKADAGDFSIGLMRYATSAEFGGLVNFANIKLDAYYDEMFEPPKDDDD